MSLDSIIFPVTDLGQAKALYARLLGMEPYVYQPYYVGFKIGDLDIGLDPNGHKQGVTAYWEVADIKESLQALLAGGAQAQQAVKDVGGGKLIATVKDADGNILGLSQSPR